MTKLTDEITLRDVIALTVLHAEISARRSMGFLPPVQAREAYSMADAMIEARSALKEAENV